MKQVSTLAFLFVAAAALTACADFGFTPGNSTNSTSSAPTARALPANISEADKGFLAMQAGDLEKAERYYIKALNANPKDPYANLNMGVLYHNTGHFDLAQQYYRVVIGLNSYIVPKVSELASEDPVTLTDIARSNLELLQSQTGK